MRFEISFVVACFTTDGEFTGFGAEDLVVEADGLEDATEITLALIGEERGLQEYLYRAVAIMPSDKPPSRYDNDTATWNGVLARIEGGRERFEYRFGEQGAIIGLRKKPEYARRAKP